MKLLPWLLRGLPDRLLVLPGGWIAFVEFKASKGALEKLQIWWRDRLQGMGCRWYEVRDWDQFQAVLRDWRLDTRQWRKNS